MRDYFHIVRNFSTVYGDGQSVWDHGSLLEVAVHICETVTQPYFGFCCLQYHHSFYDNVLQYVL